MAFPGTSKPITIADIEVSRPIESLEGRSDAAAVYAIIRLHGAPVGSVTLPLTDGACPTDALADAIIQQHGEALLRELIARGLEATPPTFCLSELMDRPRAPFSGPFPRVTVAVCTRDRPDHLSRCLAALCRLEYPALELIVVDNAPSSPATERLVRAAYPQVRYLQEPRPGLDWARNRAILEASGEIIAFTDDDAVVDAGWVAALAALFAGHSEVMAVTGLVLPLELESEAQILFEQYGGFGRGFQRQWYRVKPPGSRRQLGYQAAGQFGTGANMAFRRTVFERIGGFDPALDVGTVTEGAGDLEFFFRVLKAGYTLVYEPGAIVRHSHRRERAGLAKQLTQWGTSFVAYLERNIALYPEERSAHLRLALWWALRYQLRLLVRCCRRHRPFPVSLVLAELHGALRGPGRYRAARNRAAEIERAFGPLPLPSSPPRLPETDVARPARRCAVRSVDVAQPLQPLTDLAGYAAVRVCLLYNGDPLGWVDLATQGETVSITRLRDAVSQRLASITRSREGRQVLEALHEHLRGAGRLAAVCPLPGGAPPPGGGLGRAEMQPDGRPASGAALPPRPRTSGGRGQGAGAEHGGGASWPRSGQRRGPVPGRGDARGDALPTRHGARTEGARRDVTVSVVIATYDRPDDLRRCLRSVCAQEMPRSVEVVVVDNHPASGLTPGVVAEFPGVVMVSELRRGLAYARNAGFRASTGEIVAVTDDDVICPPDWLERLLAPFVEPDVMGVTGNVLPLELETPAQSLFELYGGLGKGFERKEADRAWFESFRPDAVPTWELGATANAAFRASIFMEPAIGLMDEALGPGMPSGCGEDTYLFYRLLRAGHRLVYEPTAYVWHRHRRSLPALRRQLYNYSKGHVAYHLTTLLRDRDGRALWRLGLELPHWQAHQILRWARRRSEYPLTLILVEIMGHLAGPWALWQSSRRVRREGRGGPYLPIFMRDAAGDPGNGSLPFASPGPPLAAEQAGRKRDRR
jgi:GT2 family glycosyltransferase